MRRTTCCWSAASAPPCPRLADQTPSRGGVSGGRDRGNGAATAAAATASSGHSRSHSSSSSTSNSSSSSTSSISSGDGSGPPTAGRPRRTATATATTTRSGLYHPPPDLSGPSLPDRRDRATPRAGEDRSPPSRVVGQRRRALGCRLRRRRPSGPVGIGHRRRRRVGPVAVSPGTDRGRPPGRWSVGAGRLWRSRGRRGAGTN